MSPRRGRGRFVVLEGLDGAGTTTQARLLGERLRATGRRVHVTAEPSGGPAGALVRQVLTHRVSGGAGGGFDPGALALLFAADRLDHLAAEILPKLEAGVDVVSDRYTLSSLAYQSLTIGDARWVAAVNAKAAPADLVLFLKVRPKVAVGRREAASIDRELYEVAEFQRRVARSYDRAVARLHAAGHRVEILDGEKPVDEVAETVWGLVRALRAGAAGAR
jgi:dTMP kinase